MWFILKVKYAMLWPWNFPVIISKCTTKTHQFFQENRTSKFFCGEPNSTGSRDMRWGEYERTRCGQTKRKGTDEDNGRICAWSVFLPELKFNLVHWEHIRFWNNFFYGPAKGMQLDCKHPVPASSREVWVLSHTLLSQQAAFVISQQLKL